MMLFDIKDGVNIGDLKELRKGAFDLFHYFVDYCFDHGLRCMITSIMDDAPGRVHDGHEDGRCFDASIKGWSESDIEEFVHITNANFIHIAAVSEKDLIPRAVVCHGEGEKRHLHIQCKRNLT